VLQGININTRLFGLLIMIHPDSLTVRLPLIPNRLCKPIMDHAASPGKSYLPFPAHVPKAVLYCKNQGKSTRFRNPRLGQKQDQHKPSLHQATQTLLPIEAERLLVTIIPNGAKAKIHSKCLSNGKQQQLTCLNKGWCHPY